MPALRDWRLPVLVAGTYVLVWMDAGRAAQLLFLCAAGVLLLSGLWAGYAARSLRLTVAVSRAHLQAGETAELELELRNAGVLPVPWLEVTFAPAPQRDGSAAVEVGRVALSLGPRQAQHLKFTFSAGRRGVGPPGVLVVDTGDGLGIFRGRPARPALPAVTVYPRVPRLPNLVWPVPMGLGFARAGRGGAGDPASLAGMRPYQPGDSPRHIHWATTARRGELFLKQFDSTSTAQVSILLDVEASGYRGDGGATTMEAAVELAAGLGAQATRQGFALGIWAAGPAAAAVPIRRGPGALSHLLSALVHVEATGTVPCADLARTVLAAAPPGLTLAVITPQVSKPLVQCLAAAAASRSCMLFVVQPAAPKPLGAPPPAAPGTELAAVTEMADYLAARRIPVYFLTAGGALALHRRQAATPGAGGWTR